MERIRNSFRFMGIALILITYQSCNHASERQEQNKASIIRANDELFNKGNVDFADQVFAADYSGRGPALIKEFTSARRAAFPDLQVKVEPVVADGNMVAWLRTNTGTHTGDYAGRKGTSRTVSWKEMVFTRYNEEGKVEEEWGVSNMNEMLNAASGIEGVYEYLPPLRGQGVNRNGRFVYLFGTADGKGPMISEAGTQIMMGDTVRNTITFSTHPDRIGTTYAWRVTERAGDTTAYEIIDEEGKIIARPKALKVSN